MPSSPDKHEISAELESPRELARRRYVDDLHDFAVKAKRQKDQNDALEAGLADLVIRGQRNRNRPSYDDWLKVKGRRKTDIVKEDKQPKLPMSRIVWPKMKVVRADFWGRLWNKEPKSGDKLKLVPAEGSKGDWSYVGLVETDRLSMPDSRVVVDRMQTHVSLYIDPIIPLDSTIDGEQRFLDGLDAAWTAAQLAITAVNKDGKNVIKVEVPAGNPVDPIIWAGAQAKIDALNAGFKNDPKYQDLDIELVMTHPLEGAKRRDLTNAQKKAIAKYESRYIGHRNNEGVFEKFTDNYMNRFIDDTEKQPLARIVDNLEANGELEKFERARQAGLDIGGNDKDRDFEVRGSHEPPSDFTLRGR